MKTVSVESLLPRIVPLIAGCNDDLAKIILADAARTFARESDIVIETRGFPENEAPEYGRMPEFAVDEENFLPLHFIARKVDHDSKRVYVTYSLLPTGNLMPESVIERHYEAITSQALFQLYGMPGKPWTSPDMANLYLQKYRIALGDAMRDNNTGGAVFDQFMICCEPGDPGYIGSQNISATVIGTDTSDGNITPNTVLAGYVGYAKGENIVGNIKSVTASLNKNIFTVPMGYVGSPVTLSIPEVTATLYKNIVTVPVGYIGEKQELTVPVANITNDGEYVTVPVGYVESERKFKVGGSSGVNVDFVTAAASDILAGKVGSDKDGNPVYGNIQTVTASKNGNVVNVPKGYIAAAQTLTIDAAKTATVSGNLVTVYPGYTATQYTVSVTKATSSVSGNVVTIPAGYHDATTRTVSEAGQTTVSGNVVTTPVGYVKSERKNTVGTAKGAETYTPGTADKTIAAGTYLSGALTIKGDANLKAENIADGKSIFGIAGSFKGGGAEFFKCASVDTGEGESYIQVSGAGIPSFDGNYYLTDLITPYNTPVYKHESEDWYYYLDDSQYACLSNSYDTSYMGAFYYKYSSGDTWYDGMGERPAPTVTTVTAPGTGVKSWTGYKAVLTNGEYQFEEVETTGLTFSLIVPVVGKVYTADALVTVDYIYAGMPTPYIDWAMNSYSGTVNGESWNFMQGFYGNHEFSPDGVNINGDGYIDLNGLTTDLLQGDFTIALEVNQTSTGRTAYFAANDDCYIGIDDNQNTYNMWAGNGGWNILQADSAGYDNSGNGSIAREYNKDITLVYVHSGTVWKLYVNGVLSVEKNRSGNIGTGNTLRLAAWGGAGMKFAGKMRNFKLFREALPEALIKQL